MDAREEILARVRRASADLPRTGPEADTVDWAYAQPTPVSDVLDVLEENILDYQAHFVRASGDGVPGAVVDALRSRQVGSVVVPPGLDESWVAAIRDAGIELVVDEGQLDAHALERIGGVVTGAAVAMAETGTLCLDSAPDQGRRIITLVPDVHVCVVRADQVVSDVPEGMARLAPAIRDRRPVTWISGGSATSDIELSRVEGVHGPRKLHVVLAD